jgi:hypothetical protein
MSKTIRTVKGSLFGLGVAAALGFGATQALAAPPPPCPLTSFGSCSTQANCERTCERAGYPVGRGCDGGCCYCLFV